jgi:hypothetical protein
MKLNEALHSAMVARGVVLIASFEGIDHKKFFVVVGDGGDSLVGFFFINSNISSYIRSKKKFLDMQMHVKRSCYPNFLTHDSFIDCHELHAIPKSKLVQQLQAEDAQYCGELTPDDLELMLDNVRNSTIYPDAYKKTFFKP